jgi:hypothetical protein
MRESIVRLCKEKYTYSPHTAAPGAEFSYVVLGFHRKVKAILTASRAGIATTCCPWVAQREALAEQEEGDFFSVKPTSPWIHLGDWGKWEVLLRRRA